MDYIYCKVRGTKVQIANQFYDLNYFQALSQCFIIASFLLHNRAINSQCRSRIRSCEDKFHYLIVIITINEI